ncbi:TetR family transcriptional regulator [Paractinoplanes abujensis]|uniref:AcrR family transcriptional regulator n=1 Tax=Paractinoplanes abujensis TaxID=882441 RepID=A0A7W7CZH1_9ACTN|nr:TetR/AcrR family transcriptional regulator [Actinoplanes abujensis]MBB4697545.1 AcrR family transcriptional regulator [Actinoplanes abujensis]GID19965.1 TetR family transcriptional regulator [Actinoplanes abujensis]
MPTGVALRDVRQQLFDAAERVLVRAGHNALTSRAVTAEADVAKGVLHRHFADFDEFLAELVRRRIAGLQAWGATMIEHAGTGTVAENIADFLFGVFDRVGLGLVSLVIGRGELRARLQGSPGVPLLAEAAAVIAAYLSAENRKNPDMLALSLIGSAHLVFSEAGDETDPDRVRDLVSQLIATGR